MLPPIASKAFRMLLKLPCLCLPLKHNKQMHWWKNGFSIFYTGKSALPIKTLLCPTKSPMPLWKEAKSEGFQWGFDDFSLWPKKHRERAIKEVLFKVFSIAEESTRFSSLVTIQTTKDSIFFWIQFFKTYQDDFAVANASCRSLKFEFDLLDLKKWLL